MIIFKRSIVYLLGRENIGSQITDHNQRTAKTIELET